MRHDGPAARLVATGPVTSFGDVIQVQMSAGADIKTLPIGALVVTGVA